MRLTGSEAFQLGTASDRERSLAVPRKAVELGVNHIDTAAFYFSVAPRAPPPQDTALELRPRLRRPHGDRPVELRHAGAARARHAVHHGREDRHHDVRPERRRPPEHQLRLPGRHQRQLRPGPARRFRHGHQEPHRQPDDGHPQARRKLRRQLRREGPAPPLRQHERSGRARETPRARPPSYESPSLSAPAPAGTAPCSPTPGSPTRRRTPGARR